MDGATLTRPTAERSHPEGPDQLGRGDKPRRLAASAVRGLDAHRIGVLVILAATLGLRLWGIKQGLPYSYNVDEATHFVPKSVAFLSGSLNPHYFLNPPAYSYLLSLVFELWFGSSDAVSRAYATHPTEVFIVARAVVAGLGTISVWLTYLAAARFFNRTVGLLAAAIFGFAFLPVFYSHLALNDVPTLAPVALALFGSAGVMRRGRRQDYVVAGLGVGLAAATKYTGAFTLACLLVAALCDASTGTPWQSARRLALALVLVAVAFVAANPYALLRFSEFRDGVSQQASLAAGQDPVKLGTRAGGGVSYYLWTFTWGLGWAPTLFAVAGAVLLVVRRRIGLVLVLIPTSVAFIVYMGHQQRYFGRWLMPLFPIAAMLAAYAVVGLVRWLIASRSVAPLLAGGLAAVAVLGQSVTAAVHNDAVLSRPDTRNLTRAWMVSHVPPGSKLVIEPLVPDNWANDIGVSLPYTPTGERWWRYPTWLSDVEDNGNPLPAGEVRYVGIDKYERTLRPALLDDYVARGFCYVVLGSLQAGRAFAQPADAPRAVAYYALLAERSRLIYHVSPFARGSHPVPFNFDWSIDYYARQYHRPGPEISVYRLTGGNCGR
jgi:uncharacterized membrane protein (GlpM family)